MDFCEDIEQRISQILDEEDLLEGRPKSQGKVFDWTDDRGYYKFVSIDVPGEKRSKWIPQFYKGKEIKNWNLPALSYQTPYGVKKERRDIASVEKFLDSSYDSYKKMANTNKAKEPTHKFGNALTKGSSNYGGVIQLGSEKINVSGSDYMWVKRHMSQFDGFEFKDINDIQNHITKRILPDGTIKRRSKKEVEQEKKEKTLKENNKQSENYEKKIASDLDDFLSGELKHKDDSLRDQHFYSINTGKNTSMSDVLVVHDRKKFNKDKIKTTERDSKFFIEVKLDKLGSFLNPTFSWNSKDGFKRLQTFAVNDKSEDTGNKPSDNIGQVNDEKEILNNSSKYLTDILNNSATEQMKLYEQMIKKLFMTWNSKIDNGIIEDDRKFDINDIQFPKSLKDLTYIFNKTIDTNESDFISAKELVRLNNKIKLETDTKDYNEGDGSLYLLKNYTVDEKEINNIINLIIQWYTQKGTDKDCAYIQIGPQTKTNEKNGNLYLLNKDNNPLNLNIPLFRDVYKTCKIDVFFVFVKNRILLTGSIRFPTDTTLQSTISLDNNDDTYIKANDVEITGDFFKS